MSNSLAPECNPAKERYDACFLKWYSESFLRNAKPAATQAQPCARLFDEYNTCLWKALRARGVDALVEEARAEARESDEEYLLGRGGAAASIPGRGGGGAGNSVDGMAKNR